MKNYSNNLKLAPFALIILLVFAGISKCSESKPTYITNSNFHKISAGMTEQDFLEWIKPNYTAVNGKPITTKLYNYAGSQWKAYVFEIMRVNPEHVRFDHYEHVTFKDGIFVEHGEGILPLTIRQNLESYNLSIQNR